MLGASSWFRRFSRTASESVRSVSRVSYSPSVFHSEWLLGVLFEGVVSFVSEGLFAIAGRDPTLMSVALWGV